MTSNRRPTDGVAVLELDRVLDSTQADLQSASGSGQVCTVEAPGSHLEQHEETAVRMDAAPAGTNEQALFHPHKTGQVVRSGNKVAGDVIVFHERLGIEVSRSAIEATPWRLAANSAKDDVVETCGLGGG